MIRWTTCTLMGPLIDDDAVAMYTQGLEDIKAEVEDPVAVRSSIVPAAASRRCPRASDMAIVQHEVLRAYSLRLRV